MRETKGGMKDYISLKIMYHLLEKPNTSLWFQKKMSAAKVHLLELSLVLVYFSSFN